jgi:hypothetical protein
LNFLTSLFVLKPLNIFIVAVCFLTGYLVFRFTDLGVKRKPRSLLIASCAWGLYAAYELLVLIKTPEANIRVDLLVIWPVLAILTLWALYRMFR